jgi:hypothetical protein
MTSKSNGKHKTPYEEKFADLIEACNKPPAEVVTADVATCHGLTLQSAVSLTHGRTFPGKFDVQSPQST